MTALSNDPGRQVGNTDPLNSTPGPPFGFPLGPSATFRAPRTTFSDYHQVTATCLQTSRIPRHF